jgi:hypothetical protein
MPIKRLVLLRPATARRFRYHPSLKGNDKLQGGERRLLDFRYHNQPQGF